MDELNKVNLDEFLKQYGFDESDNLTDKQKLKILRHIIFNNDFERDIVEMRYNSISEETKTQKDIDNFVNELSELDIENMKIKEYIYALRREMEEKRQIKRKERIQKILTIFKKK